MFHTLLLFSSCVFCIYCVISLFSNFYGSLISCTLASCQASSFLKSDGGINCGFYRQDWQTPLEIFTERTCDCQDSFYYLALKNFILFHFRNYIKYFYLVMLHRKYYYPGCWLNTLDWGGDHFHPPSKSQWPMIKLVNHKIYWICCLFASPYKSMDNFSIPFSIPLPKQCFCSFLLMWKGSARPKGDNFPLPQINYTNTKTYKYAAQMVMHRYTYVCLWVAVCVCVEYKHFYWFEWKLG